jgi:hypothetical protein
VCACVCGKSANSIEKARDRTVNSWGLFCAAPPRVEKKKNKAKASQMQTEISFCRDSRDGLPRMVGFVHV